MRRFLLALAASLCAATPILAGGPLPERRLVVTRNVDFPGGDLQSLFDTTLEACRNACLNNAACHAFTFNTRSNACFPKSAATGESAYDGAVSARVQETDPALIARAGTRAAALGFLDPGDLPAALTEAGEIALRHGGGQWSVPELLEAARKAEAQDDLANALQWTGAALAQSDATEQWLDYGRLALRFAQSGRSNDRWELTNRAVSAALNGYLRAGPAPQQASALLQMAQALEAQDRGRLMIPALRLAQDIAPRPEIDAALDDAIGKYGFRIVEDTVEAETADPRICAVFSEDLIRAGEDYTPFVRLPDPKLAVVSDDRRVCVTGVSFGERYTLTFRAGLPSAAGEELAKDVPVTLYVRDRSPKVSFPGRAYVLPKSADAGLPVQTVNLSELDLTLRRISDRNLTRAFQDRYFGTPLSAWQLNSFSEEIAEEVWTGKGEVENRLNADMLTRLPMGDVVGDLPAGIYALTASVPGADPYDDPGATQWFVLSDIGLTTLAGTDGITVFTRALSDAAPLEGLEVSLISRANRVLGTASSDAQGVARFAAGLTRGTGAAEPALLVAKRGEEDVAFLSLTDPAFDLSDRGVAGRAPAGPVDAFLTTDRGAYRAGETIHATALLRDDKVKAIPGLPLTAVLTRPDGVELMRLVSDGGIDGGHVFTLPLAPSVPRGMWRLSLYADPKAPALTSQTLLVEDFVPERIDLTLTLPDAPIAPASPPLLEVETRYLFGAPGADLPLEGEVTLTPQTTFAGLPGYRFGLHDAAADALTEPFPADLRSDADGRASLPLPLPAAQTDQPQEARITLRATEGSGRPVERSVTRPVLAAAPMIGIRPEFEGTLPEGGEAGFLVQGFAPDLSPAPMEVEWRVNRIDTRYQWYQLYGNWNWEPVTTRKTVASGSGRLGGDPLRIATPTEWGQYELVVERTGGDYTATSVGFDAGWYAAADAVSTPDTLELSLDKPGYRPGETAHLRIVPRAAGQALVTVLSDRVIAMKAVEVTEGENLIDLPVTEEWGAGAYVTAEVLRPMDVAAGQNPARSLGLAHASIDPGARRLDVSFDAPAESAPRGPLTASVQVGGVAEGAQAHVTVAAVDLGILNLTGFESPDPAGYYFGQRRLGVEIRDLYGRLIDGMNGDMGRIRSGGDAEGFARLQSPPPTEALVAFFSGPVTVGPEGRATVSFDMPDFNGTVRLMAVAWTDTAVGQAEADVLVRDPVVISAAMPRFLAPGDRSRLQLELTRSSGGNGPLPLEITAQGVTLETAALPASVTLAEGETTRLSLPLTAGTVGDATIEVALTTPEGQRLTKTLTLGTRANDPQVGITRRLSLAPGQSFTLDGEALTGLRPDGAELLVSAGPLAQFDAPGMLAALDRYPYGCTEQVTSQALPLLYLSAITEPLGLGGKARIDTRIEQAITRVLTRQDANGAFGLWRAESGDFWLDAYVTDFLTRARATGHPVPDLALRTALDNLRNRIAYAPDFDEGGEDIAYALMVLAREGQAAIGDLRYYADQKPDDFATPLAQAQLGAALASYGDQTRADRLFAKAAQGLSAPVLQDAPVWRTDYGTGLRDAAGVLTLATEARSQAVDREALITRISLADRALSTQEQSWSLLAAHALVQDPTVAGIALDGTPVSGPFLQRFDGAGLTSHRIANTGNSATPLTVTALGVPEGETHPSGYGFALTREYYSLEGAPVSGPVPQGTRLVAVLTVKPAQASGARLMVNDALPAGFEIDNPNLLRSGDIRALDWLNPAEAQYTEARTDRFLAAVDLNGADPIRLAYIVRAVSPGTFHLPAALVEDMYRPEFRATTGSGQVVIQ